MRNHNVHGTVCQRREAAAVAPQSEFLRELHRRWTSSGLLREIDVALAHLEPRHLPWVGAPFALVALVWMRWSTRPH